MTIREPITNIGAKFIELLIIYFHRKSDYCKNQDQDKCRTYIELHVTM